MNSLSIYLSAEKPTTDYTNFYGPFLIKGAADVYFILNSIQEEADPVVRIEGFFGDGVSYKDTINLRSDIQDYNAVELVTTGKIGSIKQQFNHVYEKDATTFVTYMTASFFLTYTSQYRGIHNIAFAHVKDSYYDDIKQLHVNSTQMMPVSSNDIFAIASSSNGNAFYLYFGKNEMPLNASSSAETLTATFLSPQTLQSCYILQAQQGGAIVPRLST